MGAIGLTLGSDVPFGERVRCGAYRTLSRRNRSANIFVVHNDVALIQRTQR